MEDSLPEPKEGQNQETLNQPPKPDSLKQIRTFQGDVASALSRGNESLVSIQRKEAIRQEAAGTAEESKGIDTLKVALLSLGTLVFIGLGAYGGWYAYGEYLEKTAPPDVPVIQNRFISSARESVASSAGLDRASLIKAVADNSQGGAPGEVNHIMFSPELTTEGFFGALETNAPGSLVRAFEPEFMLGSAGESVFIIFKLASYENAFAGMLLWEESMAEDIGPVFGTRAILQNIARPYVFRDYTDRNKDARALFYTEILTDEETGEEIAGEEKEVLLYTFFENDMLIITDNLDTMRAVIARLSAELLSR